MFDFLLYPVSAILWFWHTVFAGPFGGLAWVLAIVFLVVTVRALLIRPALGQLRAARRARELAPRLAKLRKRHAGDRQRLGREMLFRLPGLFPRCCVELVFLRWGGFCGWVASRSP